MEELLLLLIIRRFYSLYISEHVICWRRGKYHIAVVGRGLQVINFDSMCDLRWRTLNHNYAWNHGSENACHWRSQNSFPKDRNPVTCFDDPVQHYLLLCIDVEHHSILIGFIICSNTSRHYFLSSCVTCLSFVIMNRCTCLIDTRFHDGCHSSSGLVKVLSFTCRLLSCTSYSLADFWSSLYERVFLTMLNDLANENFCFEYLTSWA